MASAGEAAHATVSGAVLLFVASCLLTLVVAVDACVCEAGRVCISCGVAADIGGSATAVAAVMLRGGGGR
jgi:hypothetical protein